MTTAPTTTLPIRYGVKTLTNEKVPFRRELKKPLVLGDEITIYGVPRSKYSQQHKFELFLGIECCKRCGVNNKCIVSPRRCRAYNCKVLLLGVEFIFSKSKIFRAIKINNGNSSEFADKSGFPFKINKPYVIKLSFLQDFFKVFVDDVEYHSDVYKSNITRATEFIFRGKTKLTKIEFKTKTETKIPTSPVTIFPKKDLSIYLERQETPFNHVLKTALVPGDDIIVRGLPTSEYGTFSIQIASHCEDFICRFHLLVVDVVLRTENFKTVVRISQHENHAIFHVVTKFDFQKNQPYSIKISLTREGYDIYIHGENVTSLSYKEDEAKATNVIIEGNTFIDTFEINRFTDPVSEAPDTQSSNKTICTSPACKSKAFDIRMNMNNSVDPCDDFYQFACGGWEKRHTIYDGMNGVFHDDIRNAKTQKLVIQLLREKSSPNELPSLRRTKDWFKSCEDQAAINARGAQPFKDWLSTTFGGWPLLHYNTDYASINLTELVVKAYRNSFENLFEFKVRLKVTNDSRDAIEIDFPTNYGMRGLQEIPRNLTDVNNYTTYIYNVTKLLGLADPSTALSDAADIVDFELELSKITPQPQLIGDVSTVSEVDELYSTSKFNFGVFFKMMLATPGVDITDVTESEPIYVQTPSFFEGLRELINNTSMKTIVNFVMWKVTHAYLDTLGKEYTDLFNAFKKSRDDQYVAKPREKHCVSEISSTSQSAIAKLFVDRYGNQEVLKMVGKIQDYIEDAFSEALEENDWMSNATKAKAEEKSRFMARKIGWPDIISNETALEKFYENFTYESGKYFENVVIQIQQKQIAWMKTLRTKEDRLGWFVPDFFSNPKTFRTLNDITIPVAYLQRPSFSPDYPQYINYGKLGVDTGSTRLLNFDNQGFTKDKYGRLKLWITLGNDSDWSGYVNRTDCMNSQFQFFYEEMNITVPGRLSEDANVGDTGGLKHAFRAYKNWVKDQGKKEPLLPGLNYSQDQLFFIQAAQGKCGKVTKIGLYDRVVEYPHFLLSRVRVNAALRNNKDFSEVFKCASTSYMNPPDKCAVY